MFRPPPLQSSLRKKHRQYLVLLYHCYIFSDLILRRPYNTRILLLTLTTLLPRIIQLYLHVSR